MEFLIWPGAALSLTGVFGLVYCIVLATRAKRAGGTDEEIRAKLQKVVALNLGSLLLSALGLMLVVVGIFLG
ncbi:hypothetical protein [Candidatus Halocynthiibacter alkanivorans]|mgnify:CR=1 FL=1|jgi:hypothetical protein|uniref:hypothetical protein n=1 Tax=Candidatus Halocynthiibacter alkanivorans TaxID=2267619 RepID=UPI000DF4A689|nr:hypothetical protein [Candidatus Halocynthiibacter alkanivorans]